MAVELLTNAIFEYVGPMLTAIGISVDPNGFLIENGKRICMKNMRYNEAEPMGEFPLLYPVVPITDQHYLEIKENKELELFNPFENIRHMCLVAIKMKKLAVVDLNQELLSSAVDEDDYDRFDEYIGLSNDVNEAGMIDYQLVDLSTDNQNTIMQFLCPRNEPIKGLYGLCSEMYNRYVSIRPPFTKAYENVEWGWKKIHAAMNKWDKAKKTIVAQIKKENTESMNIDYMDLSESVSPDAAVSIYNLPKVYSDDDYVGGNCEDINNPDMLRFITNLFDPSDLKVYEEPKVEINEPKIEKDDYASIPSMSEGPKFVEVTAPVEHKEIIRPTEPISHEEPKSIKSSPFKRSNNNSPNINPMIMNGMNPMLGNGYGYGYGSMPAFDINEMVLDDTIDPYKFYR